MCISFCFLYQEQTTEVNARPVVETLQTQDFLEQSDYRLDPITSAAEEQVCCKNLFLVILQDAIEEKSGSSSEQPTNANEHTPTSITKTPSKRALVVPNWQFSEIAPLVFKRLREFAGVSEVEYTVYYIDVFYLIKKNALGFGHFLGNLLLGNLSTMKEIRSSSRSGSLFFRSGDGNFFLKTIPPDEELTILDLLPAWLEV